MIRVKVFLVAAGLAVAAPASFGAAAAAEQAADAKAAEAKPAAPAASKASEKSSDESAKPALSKGDLRKLDAKCSDEADAKHLHGEARKTFRSACKSKGGFKPA